MILPTTTPGDRLRPPSGSVNSGNVTRRFHESGIRDVRIYFLQDRPDGYARALTALGSVPYEVTDLHGAEPAKAWCVMRAEIAIAQRDFAEARRACLIGDDLNHPRIPASPLYSAMFCSIHAEALRREGSLTDADALTLATMIDRISSLSDPVGQRHRFIEYAMCRTLGLHLGKNTDEGRGWLDRASVARDAHTHAKFNGGGYRQLVAGAREDRDKLEMEEETPFFSAVMSLPYTEPTYRH